VVLDAPRSIARLVIQGWTIDLARQVGASLEDDLGRRDYRLNALALPLRPGASPVDPTGGLGDLERRVVVAVSEGNLLEDPLRLLRGPRLASQLGFRLEERTQGWIERHHCLLERVAPERVLVELEKLAACGEGHRGLRQALEAGLLDAWRVGARADLLERLTPEVASSCGLSSDETTVALTVARLASLFDAAGLEKLRSSRRLQGRCGRLRHWQCRLGASPEVASAALEAMGDPERLALHRQLEGDLAALALQLPTEMASAWIQRWRNTGDPLFHPRPPLDGRSLQATFSLAASPRLGALLEHLTRERAFGRVNDEQVALQAAERWLTRQTDSGERGPRRD
jgi:tRNA nucleotidyltransferase (CCA-adding enzyme)